MSKITIEKWKCDRCGIIAPKWDKQPAAYSIRSSVDYGTSGGNFINWKEMCPDCNAEVGKQLESMELAGVNSWHPHSADKDLLK